MRAFIGLCRLVILVHEGLFDLHVDSSVLRALKQRRFGSKMIRLPSLSVREVVVDGQSNSIEFVCLSSTMNVSTTSIVRWAQLAWQLAAQVVNKI